MQQRAGRGRIHNKSAGPASGRGEQMRSAGGGDWDAAGRCVAELGCAGRVAQGLGSGAKLPAHIGRWLTDAGSILRGGTCDERPRRDAPSGGRPRRARLSAHRAPERARPGGRPQKRGDGRCSVWQHTHAPGGRASRPSSARPSHCLFGVPESVRPAMRASQSRPSDFSSPRVRREPRLLNTPRVFAARARHIHSATVLCHTHAL